MNTLRDIGDVSVGCYVTILSRYFTHFPQYMSAAVDTLDVISMSSVHQIIASVALLLPKVHVLYFFVKVRAFLQWGCVNRLARIIYFRLLDRLAP